MDFWPENDNNGASFFQLEKKYDSDPALQV